MNHALTAILACVLCLALAAGCNGGNGTEDDATTDDATQPDQQDQVDTPVDTPTEDAVEDPVPDPAEDPVEDPAEDPPEDLMEDAMEDVLEDIIPDIIPDLVDVLEDGETACEAAGGYCSSYAIIYDPCITCEDIEEQHYMPAGPTDGAMGCTVEGVGAGPWCCLPNTPDEPTDCHEAGGECYSFSEEDPCPIGWDPVYTECYGEGSACCVPTSEACGGD